MASQIQDWHLINDNLGSRYVYLDPDHKVLGHVRLHPDGNWKFAGFANNRFNDRVHGTPHGTVYGALVEANEIISKLKEEE